MDSVKKNLVHKPKPFPIFMAAAGNINPLIILHTKLTKTIILRSQSSYK